MTETPTETPPWGRYAELRPDALEQILAETPVAYVPWGALEWHGAHLPLGTEGYMAEALAERAARRTGGVILPTTWWPIATIPHRFSIGMRSETLHELWDGLFSELARIGFRLIVVLSGHHDPGHDLVLMDAAEHATQRYDIVTLAIPPLALVDERMLDHAAHWETALMLTLQPRLVAMEELDGHPLDPGSTGVLGEDPRSATASQGEAALRLTVERLALSVRALLGHGGADILRELYARRRAVYQDYVDRYFRGSWEDATDAWWRAQRAAQATSRSQDKPEEA
jgi:creatinine amidohydrolase